MRETNLLSDPRDGRGGGRRRRRREASPELQSGGEDDEEVVQSGTEDKEAVFQRGQAVQGTGCLVRAVETAAHRKAHVIGKPSSFLYDCVVKECGLDPSRTVMVGDRLDTDIQMGSTCGVRTLLTLTGFSSLEDAKAYQNSGSLSLVPDFYVDSVADLLPALTENAH